MVAFIAARHGSGLGHQPDPEGARGRNARQVGFSSVSSQMGAVMRMP